MTFVNSAARKSALPPIIATRLDEVRRREASLRLATGLLDALALFLAAVFVALALDWAVTLFSPSARTALTCFALGTGGIGLLLLAFLPLFKRRTASELAAKVDRSVPGLEERWETVTWLNASDEPETMIGSRVMIDRLVAESIERDRLVDPHSIVPGGALRMHKWLLALAIGANLALFLIDPAQAWTLLRRFCSPTARVSLTQVTAASGDLAVPRGEPVRLEATIAGRPRNQGEFFLRNPRGEIIIVSLTPNDADGNQFAHAIDAADEPFSYCFRVGDGQTAWHNVAIYDRPRLTNIELKLQPPEYTHLPVVTKSELPTSLRAVEGSQLEIGFVVDQPLDHFDLYIGKDSSTRLTSKASDPLCYVFKTRLEKTLLLTPVIVSQHGLKNLQPPSCQVIVYQDRPPDVAIVSPDREISLRPTDEVTVEFAARDDFGVVRGELVAFVGDQPDLQNALVLPPQTGNETSNRPTGPDPKVAASDTKNATAPTSRQPKTADAKSAAAAKENGQSPAPANQSTPARNGKAEAASREAAPQTIVVPISLAGQAGEKNVRGKIKLDLRRFQLKQGQQLQYIVRVYDSRSARSNGQSFSDASSAADSKAPTVNSVPKSASTGPASAERKKTIAEQGSSLPQKAIASGQDTKARATDSTPAPARLASPMGTPRKSNSGSVAQAGKIDATALSQGKRKAETADRQGSAREKPRADSQPASESSSSQPERDSAKQATASAEQSQVTGAPRPPDAMTRRTLDTDSQATASSTMKIHIDNWAGSFEGQQRRKLELLIDPVLKELDAALAKALEELRPVSDALAQGKKPGDDFKKSLRAADSQIARGQSLVADLVQKSEGTPYAFIGLQRVDITELHISPARTDVKAVKADAPDRKERAQQAEVHLNRAREMLADLTRKYESVKRDLRLAEDMDRVKTMYQVFIENAMAFLASNRPALNPKDRKMAQLELDKEFLKQYRELQQEWEKTLAELAKALSKDPRLLARYMSLSRRRVDSLRDQLTLLNLRQQELLVPVAQLAGEGTATGPPTEPPRNAVQPAVQPNDAEAVKPQLSRKEQIAAGTQTVRASLHRDLSEIAAETIGVQEDLGTWLPPNLKNSQLIPLREQAAKVSTLATLAATAAGQSIAEKSATAARQVGALATQLKSFESALAKLADSDDPQVAVPVNRRLARVRKLERLTGTWIQKNSQAAAGRVHQAIEIDQHRLSEDTLELTGKLENAAAQLAGLPDDVLALADEVKDALRYPVLVDQMSAELRLRDGDYPAAKLHQKKAIDGFARAEVRFNKLIDRVIQEQDKVPPQVPDLDNMQLPTLEELLARLESETDLAELLGIPDRPSNLQALRDWLMRNGNGAGGGMAGAGNQARLVDQARMDALRAARNKAKTDPQTQKATAARWNTLGSRLEDSVRQGRGNIPPRQYRRAIERYFELISGAKNATESAAPAIPSKENAGVPGNTSNNKP